MTPEKLLYELNNPDKTNGDKLALIAQFKSDTCEKAHELLQKCWDDNYELGINYKAMEELKEFIDDKLSSFLFGLDIDITDEQYQIIHDEIMDIRVKVQQFKLTLTKADID